MEGESRDMKEDTNERLNENATEDINENNLIVEFTKPFTFEKKEYKNVDLSGIERMTGKDLETLEDILKMQGVTSLNPETTTKGAYAYAAHASGLPVEFFEQLPLKEARKVRVMIINFLWN